MSDSDVDQWSAAGTASLVKTQAEQLRSSVSQAFPVNPDADAAIQRHAAVAAVPLATARALPDQTKVQAQMSSFDADMLARKFPSTARLLTDPDTAKIAHDDIPNTQAVEKHVKALGAPMPTDSSGNIDWTAAGTQALQGPAASAPPARPLTQIEIEDAKYGALRPDNTPLTYGSRLNAWLRDLVGAPPGGRDEMAASRASNELVARKYGQTVQEFSETMGKTPSEIPEQFASGFVNSATAGLVDGNAGPAYTVPGQIASGAGQLAGFLIGAPVKIGAAIVERAGGELLAHTAGESFVKALGKDVTRQAATLGIASGVAAAGDVLNNTGTIGDAAATVGKATATGAATGAVFGAAGRLFPDNTVFQTMARVLGTSAALDAISGNRPWDDRPAAQKTFDYLLNTVFSLHGAGRAGGEWLHDAARADTAQQDHVDLTNIAATSAASKLRERDPAAFRSFVASASQDGPVPAVYIDGSKLADALHQAGIGGDELQAKLPDMAQQLPEALSTGGMVRIPIEDFATHIAGGDLQEPLMQHLRTDPDGMTLAESNAFMQSAKESMSQAGSDAAKVKESDAPDIESRRKVFEGVKAQLEATGRFPDGVNNAYAALHGSFYATQAERFGVLPHELLASYPLHIAAESPTADTLSAAERGAYDPATKTIALLKGADLSTFLHESGHHFLDALSNMAAHPDAPAGIKADMATLLKSWNVPDLETWRDMTLGEQREHHEAFARGFEKYLMEGNAPDLETRGLFARFRSWLLHVYKSLNVLKVDVHPDVKGVFDRMLASKDAIDQAETARRYMPLFDSPDKAHMTAEEWSAYQALGKDATDQAIEGLTNKTLRDLAYLDRTRSAALKALGADADAKRADIRREVHGQVMAEPIYRAWAFLTGRDHTGRPHAADADPTLGAGKLKTSVLREQFGEEMTQKLIALHMTSDTNGMDPAMVAEMFGFTDAAQLTRALTLADHPREVLEGMTDQRMLERHGEIADPQALARAADEAVHNEVRTRFIATELRTLTKAVGPARELVKAAKEIAQATIARKRVRDVVESQFSAAETRAAKTAQARQATGDTAGAAVAKRDQLLNNQLTRAARDALNTVRKGLDHLNRLDRQSIRKNIAPDILEQIDALLDRFDLRKYPPDGPTRAQVSLETWIDSQRAAGYSPAVPAEILDPAVRMHYKDMPVEGFTGLVDSVKALEHIGKERKTLTIEGQEHDLDAYVATRLVPKLAEKGERFTRDELTERPEDRLTNPVAIALDHFQSWLRAAAAQLKPQEFKRNQYDGHELLGPFGESLTDPVINANYRKVAMLKGLSHDFQSAAKKLGRPWQDSLRESVSTKLADPDRSMPGDVVPMRMTRARMIGLALHVGNESNFGKLTKGWNWEPADVWKFLHENMTAKDWSAVQTIWDLYGKHWPEMEAMNKRLGNESPDRIEPRAFPTKFGEMRGGYAAISYDSLRSRRGEKDAGGDAINPAKGLFGRDYYRPDTTTNGSMNSRIEGYNDRVDLDFHTVARKLQESIHDLAYRETLINSNKVIEHPDFRKAFKTAYGPEAYQSLREWIGQLANSNNFDQQVGALGKFLQYTRTGMVINAIAFRATTVLKHGGSAAIKSAGYFAGGGEAYLARRMAAMGTDYSAQIEGAKAKFGEIQNRLLQQDRDFRATASTLFEPDKLMAKAHRFGHAAVAWSDMMTAVPTAWAAYDRAIAVGIPKTQGGTGAPMTETQAVNYANKIVREAHGSTAEASRSLVLNTSSEAMKMFTTLYGFMNNSYGQQLDAFDKLRTAGISNGPVLARTFAAIIVPAIWAAVLTHGGAKDDESWAAWFGKAITGEVASSVPFVRDAVGMFEGYSHAGQVAPENWLATIIHATKDVYHVAKGDGKGKPIRDIADAVGMGLHIPGMGQAGVTSQFLEDVRTGKEHPANAAEFVRGVVTGHSAAKH